MLCLSWCRLGTAQRLLWIAEDMNFCPQPLICCLVELSYAVPSLPLSFGVQVHSLAQQCEKLQGQEHKEQQEGRRPSNEFGCWEYSPFPLPGFGNCLPSGIHFPSFFAPISHYLISSLQDALCGFFAGKFCVLAWTTFFSPMLSEPLGNVQASL